MASLEDTQELIQGAEVLGAGRTLGLTDDETIETKRATLRRNIERRRAERSSREGNREEAEAFLTEDDARFQAKGRNRRTDTKVQGVRVTEDYPDPFGSYKEDIYDDDGILRESRVAEEDFQTYDAEERDRFGVKGVEIDPETGFPERDRDFDLERERGSWVILNRGTPNEKRLWREGRKVATAGTKGASSRAQDPSKPRYFVQPQNAERSRPNDLAEGSMRDLKIVANPNYAEDAIAEARAARKAGKRAVVESRVKAGFNPDRAEYNYYQAEAEANNIAGDLFLSGAKGARADENIGRIDEVRRLGTASPVGHGESGNYQVVRNDDVNNFGIASPLTRQGKTIGYYGDVDGEMLELGEINSPGTRNELNVPEFTPGQEWVVENRPNLATPGGTTFGMPQVSISRTLDLFGQRMRDSGLGAESLPNPKTLGEFEAAVKSLLARGQAAGETFYRRNADGTGAQVVENPGIDDILYRLRYTENERKELANALLQVDTAMARQVNRGQKDSYLMGTPFEFGESPLFDDWSPEGEDNTQLQRIKNEKVGRGKKSKSVGAELRKLTESNILEALAEKGELFTETVDAKGNPVNVMLPNAANAIASAAEGRSGASRPFIGALANEPAERARFIRGKDRGKTEAELIEQYGGSQGTVAAEVQRRAEEDAALRAAPKSPDPAFLRLTAADEAGRGEAARSMYQAEQRELAELARLVREGKLSVPSEASLGGRKPFTTTRRGVQMAYPFQGVQQSAQIAEDATPKASSTWMGESKAGRRVNPWSDSRDVPIQRIEEVPVPASIAPDPGVRTGSSPIPMADAGGGMGGGMLPPSRTAPGYAENPNKGPQQGPRMRTEPRNNQQRRDRADNFFTRMGADPRTKRGRNIMYGTGAGLAGLAGILGLSNIEREEEEQQY